MSSLLNYAAVLAVGTSVCLVIYRLFLSPLAKFPGPKLAAATGWYETYYSTFLGGRFTAHIEELHKRYGPIVRVNPHELSIRDPEFYHVMYSGSARYDRYYPHVRSSTTDNTVFSAIPHELHRQRRATLNPYFSKMHASTAEPYIQDLANKVIDRLLNEYRGKQVDLNKVFGCLNCDILFEFCFGWNYEMIKAPDFENVMLNAIDYLIFAHHILTEFPIFILLGKTLPDWMLQMTPGFLSLRRMGGKILNSVNQSLTGVSPETSGFTPLLNPKLIASMQPDEAEPLRLMEELQTIIGAGMEVTRRTAVVICYLVYSRPEIYNRLRKEIGDATSLRELERVEYLTAVINEAIRCYPGVLRRSTRTSREPVRYGEWLIPAGTPFSVNPLSVLRSPSIFENPQEFIPERWLDNPIAPDGRPLSAHLVSFSKGPRNCIGMNVAYTMLYLIVATTLRRIKLEMVSPEEWLKIDREYFVIVTEGHLKGTWARVVGEADRIN